MNTSFFVESEIMSCSLWAFSLPYAIFVVATELWFDGDFLCRRMLKIYFMLDLVNLKRIASIDARV